jgi:hypothetical protein
MSALSKRDNIQLSITTNYVIGVIVVSSAIDGAKKNCGFLDKINLLLL